jgi:hypothetical protein
MPAPDWLARPRQRLPRTVTPFHNETIRSYVRRLATANHISVLELTPYLAGARNKPPQPDWVAIASGWPLPVLARRIHGLMTEDQVGKHSGTVCRRCMAQRGVFERVVVCRPRHINVCLRHQLWIGDIHSPEEQFDLSALPDVVTAQRAHNRLVRRHGADIADSAHDDAYHIVRRWTERRDWPEHRDRRLKAGFARRYERILMNSIELDIANYPEVVALTGLLASEHWRRKVAPHHQQRPNWAPNSAEQQFYTEARRRLKIDYQPWGYDPLAAWVDHIKRSYLLQTANHPAEGQLGRQTTSSPPVRGHGRK